MKTRIALSAVALLGLATTASPHPQFDAECTVLKRGHFGILLGLDTGERLDFDAPIAKLGSQIVTCKGDLGPGAAEVLDFANTGFPCLLGPVAHPIAKTQVWTETIKANGEATLICDFGPRP